MSLFHHDILDTIVTLTLEQCGVPFWQIMHEFHQKLAAGVVVFRKRVDDDFPCGTDGIASKVWQD